MSKETAEASLRAFEKTIGRVETKGKPAVDKVSIEALDEVVSRAGETDVRKEREAEEAKGKIESRLEFLARMYETKKAKQAEEEAETEDVEITEE